MAQTWKRNWPKYSIDHFKYQYMFKKILALVFAASPLLLQAQSRKFVIDGKMDPDRVITGKIYLAYNDNGEEMRDSSEIVKGKYHFEGKMTDGAIRGNLFWEDRTKSIHQRMKGHAQFYFSPGKTKVVNGKKFSDFTVTGSIVDEQFRDMNKKIAKNRPSEKTAQLEFINTHPDSWLSYVYLDFRMNRARDISYDEADAIYAKLSPSLKKFERVSDIKTRIDQSRLAVVGNQALPFSANDIDGKSISLSDYQGKYVFIDFWASWCHPCREENPAVTAAFHKFKGKGLNILSVSLDGTRDAWIKAVKEDKLEWPQVSNLKGFKDEVAVKYAISAIPSNFLIDPSGKIIAKDLRGAELEKKFSDIFK